MYSPRRGIHYTAPPNPDGERQSTAEAEREESDVAVPAAAEPAESAESAESADQLTADD